MCLSMLDYFLCNRYNRFVKKYIEYFPIEKKVYYHDTDSGGVVYYATYLHYLEEGRVEFCRSRHINLVKLTLSGVSFVVKHIDIEYIAPARLEDKIKIFTRVKKIGTSSIQFSQKVVKNEILLLQASVVWVCIASQFKPRAVPSEVREALIKDMKIIRHKGWD